MSDKDKAATLPDVGKAPAPAPNVSRETRMATVLTEGVFATNPAAVARLRRGDTVPFEDCGWCHVQAGQRIDLAGLDPFIVASMKANGIIAAGGGSDG